MAQSADFSPKPLSSLVSRAVDWKRINDTLGMAGAARGDEVKAAGNLTEQERTRMREAFNVVKAQFEAALKTLKGVMRYVIAGTILAIALAIVGGVLIQFSPYAALLSLAGVGTLIGLLVQMWNLARDQAMLELVPARYALALEFCKTMQDARELIAKFLAETNSLRATS